MAGKPLRLSGLNGVRLPTITARSRNSRVPITALFALVWYGLWAFLSIAVARMTADPESIPLLITALPGAMLLVFIYWQIVPIMMVSTGVSLDLSRLLVYPIPHVQMFTIEVLLRVTTCVEMLLVSAGFGYGLLRNPGLSGWGTLAVIVFACCNLFVSAGLKDLLGRLLIRKGFREALVFLLVLIAALPQLLLVAGPPKSSRGLFDVLAGRGSPWGATARLSLGNLDIVAMVALVFWTALAWYFGRNQFERTLRFDVAEAKAAGKSTRHRNATFEVLLGFISRILRDPLAALVEKEDPRPEPFREVSVVVPDGIFLRAPDLVTDGVSPRSEFFLPHKLPHRSKRLRVDAPGRGLFLE